MYHLIRKGPGMKAGTMRKLTQTKSLNEISAPDIAGMATVNRVTPCELRDL